MGRAPWGGCPTRAKRTLPAPGASAGSTLSLERQPVGERASARACSSALRTSDLTLAPGFSSLMASPSFCPPVIFAFRSGNEIPRFCEACSAAAQSSVLRNPAHASCVDMPAGTMAARRVFSEADEMLDCAVVAGSLCGLDGSLCRPMVDGGPGSVDGIVEGCAVEDCAAA